MTFFKNGIIGNILKIVTGSTVAQIIYLISLPYVTRIYPPEYWGALAIVVSASMIISSFNTLQLETLLVVKHKYLNPNKVGDITVINLIITLIVMIVLFLGLIINKILYSPIDNYNLLFYGCLIAFLFGIYRTFENSHSGFRQYLTITNGEIIYRISIVFMQILFYLIGAIKYGLILSAIFSRLVSTSYLSYRSNYRFNNLKLKFNKKLIFNNLNYSRDITLQNLLNTTSQYMPSLLLALSYTSSEIGNYFFILGVLQMPVNIITGSLGKVLLKEYSENDDANMNALNWLVSKYLLVIGLPSLFIVFLFGNDLIKLVFGENWLLAGKLIPFVATWVFAMSLSASFRMKYHVCNAQKELLKQENFLFISRITTLLICINLIPKFETTIMIYCLVGVIFNFILIFQAPKSRLIL